MIIYYFFLYWLLLKVHTCFHFFIVTLFSTIIFRFNIINVNTLFRTRLHTKRHVSEVIYSVSFLYAQIYNDTPEKFIKCLNQAQKYNDFTFSHLSRRIINISFGNIACRAFYFIKCMYLFLFPFLLYYKPVKLTLVSMPLVYISSFKNSSILVHVNKTKMLQNKCCR